MNRLSTFALALLVLTPACSSSDAGTSNGGPVDAGPSDAGSLVDSSTSDAGAGDAGGAYVEPSCDLRDDSGGPGQYADTCVKRSWIAPYAGSYTSPACELTIDVTGSVAATFTVKVTGSTLPGTYTTQWNGGSGLGNDSYYRFTTDATFATTKTLNFTAAEPTAAGEDAISLRIEDIDKGTPKFTGRFARDMTEVDCGTYTKK